MSTQMLINLVQFVVTPEKQFKALSIEQKKQFENWNNSAIGTIKGLCWAAIAFVPTYTYLIV